MWGILGSGRMAKEFLEGCKDFSEISIKALFCSDIQRAANFKHVTIYTNLKDFLSSDIKYVYVCNDASKHFQSIMECIQNGKHVLCEKPIVLQGYQLQTIMAESKKYNVSVMEGMWTFYFPIYSVLSKMIKNGEIGTVKTIQSDFSFVHQPNERVTSLERGGGCMFELGIYGVSLPVFLLEKEATSITSECTKGETGVDMEFSATIKYGDVRSIVTASLITEGPKELVIYGTNGNIKIPCPWWRSNVMYVTKTGKDTETIKFDNKHRGVHYEVLEFMNAIEENREVAYPLSCSLMAHHTMNQIHNDWRITYPQSRKLKVAVIGAGWYGCHIATILKNKGCGVQIYEKNREIFLEASANNQNRFHLGFHYPRSWITREQVQDHNKGFLKQYEHLTEELKMNIYAIASEGSNVDFGTYNQINHAHGMKFDIIDPKANGLDNVEGAVNCDERLVVSSRAKKHFLHLLEKDIVYNHEVKEIKEVDDKVIVDGETFDYCIVCTYCMAFPFKSIAVFYEACLVIVYGASESEFNNTAITIMDGAFCSLYPYQDGKNNKNQFTLYHVKASVRFKSDIAEDVIAYRNKIDEDYVQKSLPEFEKDAIKFIPKFKDIFTYKGYYTSTRTKLKSSTDSRSCIVACEGRTVKIMSGKINTVDVAAESVCKHLMI